ncbi:hypothetical protein GIB67_008452 [Kingdonia uniflora]|uniref:Uncharacterized protein n=1 Tax=Kingdonia uniflora TaxID=39325 RepID=A0A7J7N5D3_9MAGN|nr:hypothetical protein GIB67_008452 [Kingdonia uniflora]
MGFVMPSRARVIIPCRGRSGVIESDVEIGFGLVIGGGNGEGVLVDALVSGGMVGAFEISEGSIGKLMVVGEGILVGSGLGTVGIGSVVGKVATPWAGSYTTSKASVHLMTNTLRLELRPFGIQVLLVIPGAVCSNIGNAGLKKVADKEWKLYSEFKEAIAERANASQTDKSSEATLFAKYVAKKVLSFSPSRGSFQAYDDFVWIALLVSFVVQRLLLLEQSRPKQKGDPLSLFHVYDMYYCHGPARDCLYSAWSTAE